MILILMRKHPGGDMRQYQRADFEAKALGPPPFKAKQPCGVKIPA